MLGRTNTTRPEPTGITLGEALAAAQNRYPDQRIGEILLNAEFDLAQSDIWVADDTDLIRAVFKYAGEQFDDPEVEETIDDEPEETIDDEFEDDSEY